MSFMIVDKGILKSCSTRLQNKLLRWKNVPLNLKFFLALKEVNKVVESCSGSGWEIKEEGDADSFSWAGKVYNTQQTMGRNHLSTHGDQWNNRGLSRYPPFPTVSTAYLSLFVCTRALYLRTFKLGVSHSFWDNTTRGEILGQVPTCAVWWELWEGIGAFGNLQQ